MIAHAYLKKKVGGKIQEIGIPNQQFPTSPIAWESVHAYKPLLLLSLVARSSFIGVLTRISGVDCADFSSADVLSPLQPSTPILICST
jgi:hypothetical protein